MMLLAGIIILLFSINLPHNFTHVVNHIVGIICILHDKDIEKFEYTQNDYRKK